MSFFKSSVVAAALLASANAHMTMEQPVPYSLDKLDNGPITAEQFPCKSQNGFEVSKMNSMAVGEQQTLKFKGSAVHGGGSCQLSVTMDTEPTKDSVFKVIKSIEGGCPGVDGPVDVSFTLPDSIPNGKATFAWTWFAKLSGAPEMYMNCAPIEITGGASDESAFQQLPDMFVANIGSTTCKSGVSKTVKFPNPGKDLVTNDDDAIAPPTGECGATGSSDPQPSGGASQPEPSGGAGEPAPVSSGAASQPTLGAGEPVPSPPSGGSVPSAPAGEPAPVPSNPGGVFAPSASAPAATTMMTKTGSPSGPVGTGTPSNPPTGGGSPGGASGTCSENGAIVCQGESKFGLCNNGQVVWQDVAAGTACVNGVISKRSYNGRIARPRAAY